MDDAKRETIDGVEYELRLWGPKEHHYWLATFMSLVGRVQLLGGGVAIARVLMQATFDADLYLALWAVCAKHSYKVGSDEKGTETLLDLDVLEKRGEVTPAATFVALLNKHVELQFSDFFQRLPELLGGETVTSRLKSPPA